MKKIPRILIVTDSAMLDTGFARVAREIGNHLVLTGKYHVAQHGWFHHVTDRAVPFQIFPTNGRNADAYGAESYDQVVASFAPDISIMIGDPWMLHHFVSRPRNHHMVAYIPVDGMPMKREFADIAAAFDKAVFYGEFGLSAFKQHKPNNKALTIPHGVDTAFFSPSTDEANRAKTRSMIAPAGTRFIMGCVARNNVRKQLPRLIKTFGVFVSPWWSCQSCFNVSRVKIDKCPCGGGVVYGAPKDDASLYLHTMWNDSAGHDLADFIAMRGLVNRVLMPQNMQEGIGCTDTKLLHIYQAIDLFTLPTGGEGWGLPILEAMSCGVPCLVTGYSGHMDYCDGATETIQINDFVTQPQGNMEHALVDLLDYEVKMDRFYYEFPQWWEKWGSYVAQASGGLENREVARMQLSKAMSFGGNARATLGFNAHKRAQGYDWKIVAPAWENLIDQTLGFQPSTDSVETIKSEII